MRAAVTGVGCVTGYGIGWAALRDAWRANTPAAVTNGSRVTACAPQLGGTAPRTSLLARAAAAEAWSASGLAGTIASDRAGVMMNRNVGQQAIVSRYYETLWDKGPSAVSGLAFVQTIANSVIGEIALAHQLRGPSVLVFGSSLIATALDLLREESADALLVGAVDELSPLLLAVSDAYGLTHESHGATATRVYDDRATGFRPGDGAAFVVLEREEHARARGADVLAHVRGCGTTLSLGIPGEPLRRDAPEVAYALESALGDARVDASSIDLAVTAAAGLPCCDAAELQALVSASVVPPAFALKSTIGETWSVSPLLGISAAAWMLRDGMVAATPAFVPCELPLYSDLTPRDGMRFAVVMSMDASGANDAVVVECA